MKLLYKNLLILFILITFTGCIKEPDIIEQNDTIILQNFGDNDNNLTLKFEKRFLNNEVFYIIKEDNFKECIVYIKELKSNLKKYKTQTDKINNK